MDLASHTRRLVAFNQWADERILNAVAGLTPEQYAQVRNQLAHMLGTQVWWHGNLTHQPVPDDQLRSTTTAAVATIQSAREAYARAHQHLSDYAAALTDEGWRHSEKWWAQWGVDQELAAGDVLMQVVNHGTQHRSEIAVITSLHGQSPGDLDYLNFLRAE
ncbi:MAG: hypothetical protein HYX50_02995 [Chloroflexi bacterium]|nr:hypothetical protein [Chloroflexota bacterium]